MTEIETIVEPDCVADDVWWKSVAFVGINVQILAISESLLGSTMSIYERHRFRLDAPHPISPATQSGFTIAST